MKTGEAKKVIAAALADLELGEHRLTAKTVHFSDLARASYIFVTIHNWEPNPAANDLTRVAKKHGFCVDFKRI